ncbi:MAG: permease, partial [Clostridia bacterium]
MGFVLGWNWALLRIAVGLVLVAGGVYLGQRLGHAPVPATMARAVADATQDTEDTEGPSFGRFLAALGRLSVGLLPEYVVIVGILGAVRAWLFPAMSPALGHNLLLVVGLALAGTLFVIPTAGEIPLVQSLLSYGLGLGGAGALMITLPAISLPSMAMLSQAVPKRLLLELAAWVAVMGLVTAFLAHLLL